MNKNDWKLIIVLLLIIGIFLFVFKTFEQKGAKEALVYYENDIILTIDLKHDKEYQVDGYNGKVNIVVRNGKIKVDGENSPLHLCSKQGYIDESYETIVCLPNKITIKIKSIDDNLDAVVK